MSANTLETMSSVASLLLSRPSPGNTAREPHAVDPTGKDAAKSATAGTNAVTRRQNGDLRNNNGPPSATIGATSLAMPKRKCGLIGRSQTHDGPGAAERFESTSNGPYVPLSGEAAAIPPAFRIAAFTVVALASTASAQRRTSIVKLP
jgi:hypothetical protein